MKRIIAIITLVLMTITANAQLSKGFKSFKVGDYVFEPRTVSAKMGGGCYSCFIEDENEASVLFKFISANKKALEQKYGVTITDLDNGGGRSVFVYVYDANTYKRYNEEFQRSLAEKEKAEEQLKKERISSLSTIF